MKFLKDNLAVIGIILVVAATASVFIPKVGPFNTKQSGVDEKLQVTTSFYPLWYFATQIGGNKADVTNITPAGVEPHDYDPSTQNIARIESGDMLVLNGSLETWADKIKGNLKGTNIKIVIAGEGLFTKPQDPHIWLDPKLAKRQVKKITEGYAEIDPINGGYYQDNEKKLSQKLDELDNQFKEGLKSCRRKDMVTSHTAFAYLAGSYGLNQVAISGLSPDEQPPAQQLAKVAEFAKKENVKYIFFESLVSPKLSETIANEAGAQTLVLDPIEGLSDDDIKEGKDYFSLMQENLKNLQIALQCL